MVDLRARGCAKNLDAPQGGLYLRLGGGDEDHIVGESEGTDVLVPKSQNRDLIISADRAAPRLQLQYEKDRREGHPCRTDFATVIGVVFLR